MITAAVFRYYRIQVKLSTEGQVRVLGINCCSKCNLMDFLETKDLQL